MKTEIITKSAPLPIGPYSQAVLVDNTLYISGQIALNPEDQNIVSDDISMQTKQVLDNLEAILKSAKMSWKNVVKSEIFLTNLDDFVVVNEIYASKFLEKPMPARVTVGVASLPKNAKIEISLLAREV